MDRIIIFLMGFLIASTLVTIAAGQTAANILQASIDTYMERR